LLLFKNFRHCNNKPLREQRKDGIGAAMVADQIPAERLGRAPPPELAARRRQGEEAIAAGIWRTDRERVDKVAGVRVLRFPPAGGRRARVLHLHGGGFRLGCPEMVSAFAVALADRCGVEVVCPAYRLAPEHPFPAGLKDALKVAHALSAEDDSPLIVSGDSAGGGLAAGLISLCIASGIKIAAAALLSPWLDLTVTAAAYRVNATTDPLFSQGAAVMAADFYLQGFPPEHPLASPLFADVTGFPPILISIGDGEVLADDGRSFYQQLRARGVPAELSTIAGMEHVAVTRDLNLPGAAETFQAVASHIDGALASAS
jgi:acetyl esterase/lipase